MVVALAATSIVLRFPSVLGHFLLSLAQEEALETAEEIRHSLAW